ncbi:hypothetical protein HYR99_17370 [Candidatus Poribacteria bacterium]|nr:hypothetical protein [Candidatus Poribacteria bacterium]
MSFEDYAKYLEGKDLIQLIREAKTFSDQRITGQGVADIALFMSELMIQAITANRKSMNLAEKEPSYGVH